MMQLIEVHDKKTAGAFLYFPRIIYKGNPIWISHIDQDIEVIFDPARNKQFEAGEAVRWILKDKQGNLMGRVAAFINHNLATTHRQPTGGMGFFECVQDKDAAFMLFDACRSWLEHRGMKAMDGPINFGEKERYWGLLVDGFGHTPPYLMNYNPPYYKDFFEAYGFQNYFDQYVYKIQADVVLPPILEKKYERLTTTQGYHFEHMKMSEIEKYASDFKTIYNKAWSKAHKHFKPMTTEQAIANFRSIKQVADEELMAFAYHQGEPVAFFIGIPELNQLFRYVNGKLNLMGKIRFLYHRWRGKCRVIYGLVFGIIPEYQNRGIESGLVMYMKQMVTRTKKYDSMFITWVGDFNPKMIKIVEHIGAQRMFTLTTYRKLFDEDAVFERHPVID